MSRVRVGRTSGLLLLVACGCTSALREPPSATELAGRPRHGRHQVDALLGTAEAYYASWTRGSVRTASETWLEAAAADPSRIEGWVGATRAAVWLSGHETDAAAREAAAESAVHSAQLCREAAMDEPVCSYWLAVALGVQARERRTTALDALPRMVELLNRAADGQPNLDHAGPDRVLALVLVRAPGWPTGPGDADLGLTHARRAAELEPDYPPNQLCLAEALAAVGEHDESRRLLERTTPLLRSRAETGDLQAAEWLEEIRTAAWVR